MISISETIVVSFLYNNQILKKNSCPLHNQWNDLIFLIFLLFPTMCVSLIDRAPVTFVVEKPSVERKRNPAGEQLWTVFVFLYFLYLLKVTKCIFVFDGTSSGDICGGKTFGGKKEESRWGAIVGEGVMDHPRIGGTHRLQDTNTEM